MHFSLIRNKYRIEKGTGIILRAIFLVQYVTIRYEVNVTLTQRCVFKDESFVQFSIQAFHSISPNTWDDSST